MRLNTRGRYGLQLLSQLACHLDETKPVGLKDIAKSTGLPWRYLEQIAGPLRKASLIVGRPGRAGGYRLVRPPSRITLREVMEVTSGPVRLMECVDKPETCEKSNKCTSRAMWVTLTGELRGVLDRYTLDDLAQRPCAGCRATASRAKSLRTTVKQPSRGRGASKRWKYMRSLE
ncbi:MAG: Rrf2 family transcriptional regulator [Vicinamibacterales bacterium]|nr:Rrf2 family transcriptional regulator [Vicinamibacterales bacterium]